MFQAKSTTLYTIALAVVAGAGIMTYTSCTQEQQNKISRSIQNFTGTNGVLDVMGNGVVLYRFISIDKITTGTATGEGAHGEARSYRYGYGVFDKNMNYKADPGEKKVYFEVSDYSTPYVFYENPFSE